jgi:hypothetical protein
VADVEADPYAEVLPYTTFDVADSSVVHVMVAVVGAVVDAIAERDGAVVSEGVGAGDEPPREPHRKQIW